MRVVFEREAEQEMLEAAKYYEGHVTGLGLDFLDEVEAALSAIAENPLRSAYYNRPVRSIKLARFPYRLLFVVERACVVIVAVMHLHRRPGYWKRRMN